jgi:hypothetical protein
MVKGSPTDSCRIEVSDIFIDIKNARLECTREAPSNSIHNLRVASRHALLRSAEPPPLTEHSLLYPHTSPVSAREVISDDYQRSVTTSPQQQSASLPPAKTMNMEDGTSLFQDSSIYQDSLFERTQQVLCTDSTGETSGICFTSLNKLVVKIEDPRPTG